LGDTLQFVRYLPLLSARGAAVHLEVQAPLRTLLAGQVPATKVWVRGEELPETDFHCPLLSLPGAFGTGLDSIPGPRSYLAAPAERAAAWGRDLDAAGTPKVGLVWAGSRAHRADRHRSIPLAAFQRVFRGLPARFFSLQKDAREGEAFALAAWPEVTDLAGRLADFAETAAVIARLDLVVTVDTAVAHLAGALGAETWLLLPFSPDWRWLLGREDSPWYASLRLFRQPAPGSWGPVLERVRAELGGRLRR
jgi:ADP-heptose:LPS heptosyltransferase